MPLPTKILSRLERMRFNPRQRLTSHHRGDHLRGRGGSSTEFSDYRDYSPGDDTRFIDWNIFSRLNKPYLKLFHLEEEMHIVIFVDASASMKFDGKFDMARNIASALSMIGLYSNEKVSLYLLQDETMTFPESINPCSGRFHRKEFFRVLDNAAPGGSLPLEQGVEQVMNKHVGKGMAVLISDFLTAGDISKAFNRLFSSGLSPYALQILSPAELNPELSGDVRFVDCETQSRLDVSAAGSLTEIYREYLDKFTMELSTACTKRNGLYVLTDSTNDLEDFLFNSLIRRGWIK